ncbi:helix-turn-helix domain-containing protein [Flavobacterium branchiicola]|uniref:Helix-turn-helix domain-containing protein n=1 Tax=Flavobacterium branchiicola TaxID=1114875 RepID=A0ABV9PE30_9FLAO|nr:helix-turn-helix domain-containing protein [Flavobacterium branchiicola]MBS7254034.1 AraC family transcriptional regulator [Flavobacterium branchiicola]
MINDRLTKVLLILLFPVFLFAQIDKNDLKKLSYDDLHDLYFNNIGNQKKQILYTNAYMAKAIEENSNIRKAKANYQIALFYYKSEKNKAIQYLDSVIKYSKGTNDKFFPTAAYCEKADLLKFQFKFKEAMLNYNLAEKNALQTNIDYYYVVREYIGTTKSEDLEEYNEALEIYKECYNYYKTKDFRAPKFATNYQSIIFGIADCYKSMMNTDSTSFYNKLGFNESKITNNEQYRYLFVLNEGANQVLRKNYNTALDSIKKALPKMIKYDDIGNVLAAYFYMGKAYDGLGKKAKAAENFTKVDSIYKMTNEISTEFIDGYPYLINYYKNLGDKENQLKYISEYMVIDSTLKKNYRELNKLVYQEYDTPRLISEKENLISSLNRDKIKTRWGLSFLFLTTLGVGGFALYQYHTKKQYRLRFEKLISATSIINNQKLKTENELKIDNTKIEDIGIAEEVVSQILEKLNQFEKQKGYLTSNITIQILSSTFETNSKYVSKIVNVYKEKTFTQYLNDLRIEYAVSKLKEDSKLRKYTIQALALEFGFNNAESFSTAFYKKTGLKPTYFIKEIDLATQTQNT